MSLKSNLPIATIKLLETFKRDPKFPKTPFPQAHLLPEMEFFPKPESADLRSPDNPLRQQ